jgi:FlaA1/EpsC-like NDP-sugar epimerase
LNVYSFSELSHLIEKFYVRDVLLAMPSISRSRRHQIIQLLEPYPVHVRTLPDLVDLAEGKVTVADIREVDIADLLGRESVEPQYDLLHANITNKTVMVTGAGGSIGSELCRQIIKLEPSQLVLYEVNEFGLYNIEKELKHLDFEVPIISILGTVLNQTRLESVCKRFNVNTIYHAAAYKHVPMVEKNTTEGVRNNVFGTLCCAKAAIATKVETFVLISTDKAVRPTNTMGASKRFAELVLQGLAAENAHTRFTMVRFGNVLGSSGSVVPLFREQFANGGPVTVTDPRIIRYFMTIPEAAELVIQAGAMGKGGDVFVLDMGEPIRIVELAKRMIHLSGFVEKDEGHPDGDIEITYTGLRPGEKLYEELLIGDNVSDTKHQRIMRAQEKVIVWEKLTVILSELEQANEKDDYQAVRLLLEEYVDGFQPQCDIEDWLS